MTKFDPNEPYYQGYREVLREIDRKVADTAHDPDSRLDRINAGMRDAWLRAQKVVASDIERMQLKPPPVASDLVKRKR